MKEVRILAINPGSTSTKIAVYQGSEPIFLKNIKHSPEELVVFHKISDQFHFRKNHILQQLKDADISLDEVHAVMGRGGLLKPIPSGVYEVNEAMIYDLENSPLGEHASNLGGLIAHDIAIELRMQRPTLQTLLSLMNLMILLGFQDILYLNAFPSFMP